MIREKPLFFIVESGRYFVRVPSLNTSGTRGTTWSAATPPANDVPMDRFHLARPERDNAARINAVLDSGKNALFTPGIYHLENSIRITRPGTVMLGLGYATLQVDNGTPALWIADVDGAKVGGLLIEAGAANSETLVQVGQPGSRTSHAADPIFLWDLFCRVGGAQAAKATCMVTIRLTGDAAPLEAALRRNAEAFHSNWEAYTAEMRWTDRVMSFTRDFLIHLPEPAPPAPSRRSCIAARPGIRATRWCFR